MQLLRDQTRLANVHRQRVLRGGQASPPPVLDPARFDPETLKLARVSWQRLLESEHESVVIAGWMTSALARMGAPLDIVGAFGRVVEDEIRHVDIVAEVIEQLGAMPELVAAAAPPYPAWAATDQLSEEEAIIGMTAFFCVGEELSRLIFRQSMELAKEPLAQWAVSEIHRDEAFHGAFGFETAALFLPKFSSAGKSRLLERIHFEIKRLEKRLGGPLGVGVPEVTPQMAQLSALGLPPSPVILKVFYDGIERELVPRFAKLGIDLGLSIHK